MSSDNRVVQVSLLGKLGVANATEISSERAEVKIRRRVEAEGIPADITGDERDYLVKIGFDVENGPVAKKPTPAAEPVDDKPALAEKSRVTVKPKGKAKAPAPAAKPAKKKPGVFKPKGHNIRKSGGAEAFRAILGNGKPITKSDLIERTMAQGSVSEVTAYAYIVVAKRPVSKKIPEGWHGRRNPFDFRIEEYTEKGVPMIRIKKPDSK